MIGAGPIAIELAQGMTRLGIPVTVLQKGPGVLTREEPALAARLLAKLRGEGVDIQVDVDIDRVSVGEDGAKTVHAGERSWTAAEIFVGTGRTPNVDGLGLGDVGVTVGPRGVEVDDRMRTSVKSIYAAGDVAGRFLFTHSAGYEAARAVRNMFLPSSTGGDYLVPWCTFTDPELAHAGLTEAQARAEHGDDAVARLAPGPVALRPRPRGLGGGRRDQDHHREGPHRRGACAGAERRRAHRRARAGDRPEAEDHGARQPRARLPDDLDRDPADRRRGGLRVGREVLVARAFEGLVDRTATAARGRARG